VATTRRRFATGRRRRVRAVSRGRADLTERGSLDYPDDRIIHIEADIATIDAADVRRAFTLPLYVCDDI
jgi:hypothetical protein